MALRRHLVFVLAGVLGSMGASYRTTNFMVDAPTPQIAQQVGQAAENYRKEKATLWLGSEMPPWPEVCPLKVQVTMGGAEGATTFAFDRGRVLGQNMVIKGSLDRLLASVLPHEVTHTVFAHYYRCPVPRWADEGGSVLSEDDIEINRHDVLVRQILNTPGRMIPLRRLFALREYPGDVMVLYAEGFSVAQFLVAAGGRQRFLTFVGQGMQENWDNAVRTHYPYQSVEDLEQAWLAHLRNTRRAPVQLARNTTPTPAEAAQRIVVRQTVPPAQPLLSAPMPIVRAQAADENDRWDDPARRAAASRPGYLPEPQAAAAPVPVSGSAAHDPWRPVGAAPAAPSSQPSIRLGAPLPVSPPVQAQSPPPVYPISPVGYPR